MAKVIIIGSTSGIGMGLAQAFVKQNDTVGITGRRTDRLERLRQEAPDNYVLCPLDVANPHASIEALNQLLVTMGGMDLLIICAGTGDLNESLDFKIERTTIETNVLGFTAIANWGFNHFVAQQGGHLVAISSIAGLRGGRQAPSYNATKAFQINYLEGLRRKANRTGLPLTITDIRPGFVQTDMAKGDGQFWVAPVDVAVRQILRAIEQRKHIAYITKRWRVVAALFKGLPNWLYNRM